jgi:flagellin-like hook-associated protein FlgL
MMNSLMNQVSRNMSLYQEYNEGISNERRIQKPSDDPAGLATALKHRGLSSTYEQYQFNVRDAEEYLKGADTALNQIQEILVRIRAIAESISTETASQVEKDVAAYQLQELINEAIGVANTKVRDRYIFAGTNGEFQAYSLEGKVLTPLASTANYYDDIVTAEGDYQGVGEFLVRFTQAGDAGDPGLPTTAMYQISSDGGLTWSDEEYLTNLRMTITDSEGNETGLFMTFQPGGFGEGDEFRLQVVPGKFMGTDDGVKFNNNLFSRVLTNVTGQELFEDTLFFDKLYQLKNSCATGNTLEIQEALGHFEVLQREMQTSVTKSGIELDRLEITKHNLTALQENVVDSIQKIEKWDYVDIISKFGMAENALNSSVAALSKVFPTSLLNYL